MWESGFKAYLDPHTFYYVVGFQSDRARIFYPELNESLLLCGISHAGVLVFQASELVPRCW